jgi:nucleoside-diphosphate-sugar epimerase
MTDVIAITGARGFVGRAVCRTLAERGIGCRAIVREGFDATVDVRAVGDLADAHASTLAHAFEGCTAVINLAGRAHLQKGDREVALGRLRRDNVTAAFRVADAARRAGVARFVHVSSVKVNGEWTQPGKPFRPGDAPAPASAYGHSKLAGERVVQEALEGSTTTLAIVRLPLVYGPGAPANFARLVRAVRRGRWLPLGGIDNRRHLLGLGNLAEALLAAVSSPSALVGTHFIADRDPVSTPQIIRAVADALGVRARLASVPPRLLDLAGVLSGQRAAVDRLTRCLEVDTASLSAATGWQPQPFHLDRAALPD